MEINRQTPVVTGHFLLGSIAEVKKDFLVFMNKLFLDYGTVVKFYLGRKSIYLISDPELTDQVMIKHKDVFVKAYDANKPRGLAMVMGQGLVTSMGSLWKKQRRMIQPIFHRSNIATMSGKITELSDDLVKQLVQKSGKGEVDMAARISALTLEIISQTMFGQSAEKLSSRLAGDLDTILNYSQGNLFHPFPLPLYIPSRKNRRFIKAKRFLTDSIIDIIEHRKSSDERHNDLLDVLLEARDEESGEGMSSQQIVDEALTIYSAGHETTATALTWALYLISTHDMVRLNLESEIDEILQGRMPEMKDLESLPYTRAVLEETLRMYPSIVLLLRKVKSDTIINKIFFKKDSFTLVNLYNLHRDPAYWEEPEKFMPERFLPLQRDKIQKHTYIPFGLGNRVCIGNHFAMMEAMLILTQLMQKLRFEYVQAQPPQAKLAISLRPKDGLPMLLSLREIRQKG